MINLEIAVVEWASALEGMKHAPTANLQMRMVRFEEAQRRLLVLADELMEREMSEWK